MRMRLGLVLSEGCKPVTASAVVWPAILEFELTGQLTRHYGNRVSRQFEF